MKRAGRGREAQRPRGRRALQRLHRLHRVGILVALVLWAPGASSADPDATAAALERFLRQPAVRGAQIGVSVTDLASGSEVIASNADQPLVPASNQKLLVAAVALGVWGPAHRFQTGVGIEVPPDAEGTVDGPLWIIGGGDPSLVSESLWRMAEEVRLRGIRTLQGGIAVDASWFDGQRTHPDWAPISRRAYHSPVGAFAANYSSFRLEVRPGRLPQTPALVTVVPTVGYFRVRSDAVTIPGRGTLDLDLSSLPDGSGERVRVRGAVREGPSSRTYWRSVTLPERYAAEILRTQLAAQGIRVEGPVRLGRAPAAVEPLLEFAGDSVGQIVRDMNKYSNNFIAEQLTKSLGAERSGAPGSWASGTAALREYLEEANLLGPGTVIADGSGLSPRNRISAASLTRVIRHAALRFGSGPEFLASLPLGGLDGTLRDRDYDARTAIRGKTGHLRRVASLSGVVPTPAGLRAFSVIVNGARGGRVEVDAAIDAFVAQLGEVSLPERAPERAPVPATRIEPGATPRNVSGSEASE